MTEEQKEAIRERFEVASINGTTAKLHVDHLDHDDFVALASLHVDHGFFLSASRSGTGITLTMIAN